MVNYDDVPLGRPPLRQWELNETSSRYDVFVAAPSDQELRIMWSVWVAITIPFAAYVASVFTSILISRTARINPFNAYLLYLMVPDIVYALLCGISCVLNAIAGEYWSPGLCLFQSVYLVWGLASNAWLDAVIVHQIYKMLSSSHDCVRYQPPSLRTVSIHAGLVYAFALLVAAMGVWSQDTVWPHRTYALNGEGCFPVEYSVASSVFFYAVYLPLFCGIPLSYVNYICYQVYRKKLMPKTGRRRMLSIYFLRIVYAFVIMWIPYLVLVIIGGRHPWAVWVTGTWGHLQGAVGASLSLMKPDILQCYKDFWKCRCCRTSLFKRGPRKASSTGTAGSRRGSTMFFLWGTHRGSTMSFSRQQSNRTSEFEKGPDLEEVKNDENAVMEQSKEAAQHVSELHPEQHPLSLEHSQTERQEKAEIEHVEAYMPVQNDDFTFEDERETTQRADNEAEPTPSEDPGERI